MKKALLFICFLLTASFGFAQNSFTLELEHNPVNVQEADVNKTDIIGETMVKNTAAKDFTTKWTITSVEKPKSWVFYVCDVQNCFPPTTTSSSFTLSANQSGMFACHLDPKGECGNGVVKIDFEESADVKQECIFNYMVCTSANGDLVNSAISLFPNPTMGTFSLNVENATLGRIDIYNVLGRKIKSYDGATRFFDISNEAMGIYLVQMIDENNDIVRTIRVNKVNP